MTTDDLRVAASDLVDWYRNASHHIDNPALKARIDWLASALDAAGADTGHDECEHGRDEDSCALCRIPPALDAAGADTGHDEGTEERRVAEFGDVDAWDVKPGMKIAMAYDKALVHEVRLMPNGQVIIFYGTDRLETHRGQYWRVELEPPGPLPPDYGETAG